MHDNDKPEATYGQPQGSASYSNEPEDFDPETGEVREEPEQPRFVPSPPPPPLPPPAQEVLPPGYDRAADQQIIQTVAHTGGSFVDMLEDGRLSHDLHRELAKVQEALTIEAERTGKKAKGQLVLTVDLEKEGEMYGARAKIKIKVPEAPRPKSVMWDDGAGNFTRFPPNQTQMFGTRQVRNVTR
jgi:hypothetical protein